MLNQYLPRGILEYTFDKVQLERLEGILDIVDPTKEKRIIQDQKLLGEIHHAMNIHRYKDPNFRLMLLKKAPPQLLKKYFDALQIKEKVPSPADPAFKRLVEKSSQFSWGFNNRTRIFIKTFGYPDYIITEQELKESNPEIVMSKTPPLRPLLEYQAKIFYKTLRELKIPSNHFLIQMPTGTGKTRTAMEVVCYVLNEREVATVVWVANKAELLDQALDAFRYLWRHIGTRQINVYKIWGDGSVPLVDQESSSLVIIGYDKFRSLMKGSRKMDLAPDLVIVDEAHQVLAPTYKETMEQLTRRVEKGTVVIGLSATPGRGLDEKQNQLLAAEFNYQKIDIEVPDHKEKRVGRTDDDNEVINYLVKNEILAQVEPETLYTYSEFFISNKERKNLTKVIEGDYPEYSDDFLTTLSQDNQRNIPIARRLIQLAEEKKQVLYFATSKEQSLLMYAVLAKMGAKAIHIDSDTNKEFRKAVVDKFRERDINIICNFNIFSTGFDAPNIDVIFIARPVNSPVLYSQMVGRGTRGPKMGGKEKFTLIQVIDKIESESQNFDPYSNYSLFSPHWHQ